MNLGNIHGSFTVAFALSSSNSIGAKAARICHSTHYNHLGIGKVIELTNLDATVEYFCSVGQRISKTIPLNSLKPVKLPCQTRCYFWSESQQRWLFPIRGIFRLNQFHQPLVTGLTIRHSVGLPLLGFNRSKAGRYTETEEYPFDKWMRLLTLPSSYRDRSLRHDSVHTKTSNI